jgi:DnaJ-domain-containing protein 1
VEFEAVLMFLLLVLYLIAAGAKALFRLATGAAQREQEEEQRREDERRRREEEREREEAAERERIEAGARHRAAKAGQTAAKPSRPVTETEAYELLGVSQGCTPEELAHAYHKNVSQWHPDKLESMAQELKDYATRHTARINEAYQKLRSGLVQRRVPGE